MDEVEGADARDLQQGITSAWRATDGTDLSDDSANPTVKGKRDHRKAVIYCGFRVFWWLRQTHRG